VAISFRQSSNCSSRSPCGSDSQLREIEVEAAARDGAALQDRVQEVAVAQRDAQLPLDALQTLLDKPQVLQDVLQPVMIDIG